MSGSDDIHTIAVRCIGIALRGVDVKAAGEDYQAALDRAAERFEIQLEYSGVSNIDAAEIFGAEWERYTLELEQVKS
jgi:hypothetical protein